jgi:hypothetical protein
LALETGGNLAAIASTVSAGKVQVAGTVIANAGTNLNTSALALENGGNLETLAETVSAGKVQVAGIVTANAGENLNTSTLALESGGNLATLAETVSAGKVQVAGTVTANAGTNLNTSTLALESGGNLATIAGTVAAGKVKVDPSGVTSPISAASLPLPANAAQETGGNLATIAIAQGAGGTGITEPTGGNGILSWLSGIYHTLTSTLAVSGTVTANAGTNMSTAALALESGGNLATLAGTVSAGKILVTPAQATASSLNATVVGTGTFAVQQPDVRATGQTINSATANAAYTVNLANAEGIVGFQVTGLTASGATLTIEATVDGTTWNSTNGFGSSSGSLFSTLTTDQGFRVNVGGRIGVRLRVSSIGTGTITVASSASSANDLVGISSPLPTGSNTIGGTYHTPTASSSFAIAPGSSSALETSHVLKASAGNLYSLNVTTTTVNGFLMTFNATTVPADGAVSPVYCLPVPAGSAFSISFSGAPPDAYTTGIVAVFSTTGPFTKTSSATAFFTWRVQ